MADRPIQPVIQFSTIDTMLNWITDRYFEAKNIGMNFAMCEQGITFQKPLTFLCSTVGAENIFQDKSYFLWTNTLSNFLSFNHAERQAARQEARQIKSIVYVMLPLMLGKWVGRSILKRQGEHHIEVDGDLPLTLQLPLTRHLMLGVVIPLLGFT